MCMRVCVPWTYKTFQVLPIGREGALHTVKMYHTICASSLMSPLTIHLPHLLSPLSSLLFSADHRKNKHGCDLCRCKKCPELPCDKSCPMGFQQDQLGCLICQCRGKSPHTANTALVPGLVCLLVCLFVCLSVCCILPFVFPSRSCRWCKHHVSNIHVTVYSWREC